jgi:hypothetical protein
MLSAPVTNGNSSRAAVGANCCEHNGIKATTDPKLNNLGKAGTALQRTSFKHYHAERGAL